MNIKIFGDSILKGVMYSDAEKRYKLAKSSKYDLLKSFASSIQNNSRMGSTIDKGMSLIKRSMPDDAQDTLTIMEYGGNDCDYDWKAISANPEMCYAPKTPVDKFVNLYRKAIAYAKKAGSHIVMVSLVPLDSERYMRWITRGLDYQNILRWLGDVDHLFRWQSYYNDMYGYGYGGGYSDYYSNYYTYAMMAAMYGSSTTSESISRQLDKDRYYNAVLNGPDSGTELDEVPRLELTFAIPKEEQED